MWSLTTPKVPRHFPRQLWGEPFQAAQTQSLGVPARGRTLFATLTTHAEMVCVRTETLPAVVTPQTCTEAGTFQALGTPMATILALMTRRAYSILIRAFDTYHIIVVGTAMF